MTGQTIQVNVNLDGLRGELQRALQKVMYLVATGMQSPMDIAPEKLQVPSSGVHIVFDGTLPWTGDEAKAEYVEWVLANGFRDALEAVNAFLESAHTVLCTFALMDRQRAGERTTVGHWEELVANPGRKFHRFGLPDKLDALVTSLGLSLDGSLLAHLRSANDARNCLVHRSGVITSRDVNDQDALKVSWRRFHTYLEDEDGERELVFGQLIEKASKVIIKVVDEAKRFPLNTSIKFTSQEFCDLCWSLFLTGGNVVDQINSLRLLRGYFVAPVAPAST